MSAMSRRAAACSVNIFYQEEDGIRYVAVTGVQTCALPICSDLLSLVVGSEGTLGVISHATIRVHPLPEVRAFDSFLFRSFGEGLEALRRLAQDGIAPHMAYLFDEDETRLLFVAAGGATR